MTVKYEFCKYKVKLGDEFKKTKLNYDKCI